MKINVDQLIKASGLSVPDVAKALFPGNDFPVKALNRVISGDGLLDELQVFRLSELIGCPVSDLYSGSGWEASLGADQQHVFRSGSWTAYYNANTGVTQLFSDQGPYRELIMSPANTTLTDYLQTLNELVTNNQ